MLGSTSRRARIGSQLALTAAALPFGAPLVYAVAISLDDDGLRNYAAVLEHERFPRFVANSLIVAGSTTAIVVVVTLLAAFAFSRLRPRFGGVLLGLLLVGLMIPPGAIVLPLFIELRDLGLLNRYVALIGPYAALLVPLTILLTRNVIDALPDELLDASRIDGCSPLQTLWHVVLPLVRPALAVVIVWSFLTCWNEYFFALVFMQEPDMEMVTQAPRFFIAEYTRDTPRVFASLVLISVPIVALYLVLQRRFVEGLTAGAVR